VPDITPWFWVLKLLITCMGESISDYLAASINQYLAVFIGFVIWVIAMIWMLRTPRYNIVTYWAGVSAVAVFGTMPADGLHLQLGVPYEVSSLGFAIWLAIVLFAWYRSEGTLDIHSITTTRRQVYYWLTVVSTFALGTALGDMVATPLHLGYLTAGLLFSALILIPLIAWRLGANPVLTFWVAYILTRPIGASFADLIGQPKSISGLGIGHPPVFITTAVLVIAIVIYLKRTGKDLLTPRGAVAPGPDGRAGYGQAQYEPAQYEQAGYGQQPGYSQQAEYGRPAGYAQPGGYGEAARGPGAPGGPGRGPQPGYGDQPPRDRPQPGFTPRPEYQQEAGHGQQGGYGNQPTYEPRYPDMPRQD
jgi:uncharacterized membrane-anchored protein